jgi:hypothetical protein
MDLSPSGRQSSRPDASQRRAFCSAEAASGIYQNSTSKEPSAARAHGIAVRRTASHLPLVGVYFGQFEEGKMAESDTKYLSIALFVVGLICIFGFYPLTIIWPSGWSWHTGGHSDYLQMILGIYATLGVFLVIASRNPLAHRSLIWFTIWSSIVHGGIMAAQAVANTRYVGHLWGDVLALFVVAAVLGLLMPRGAEIRNV